LLLGLVIREYKYLEVYRYETWNDRTPPVFEEGEQHVPSILRMRSGMTHAPGHLNEADLLALMDENGIGTDATMHEHIKKIQEREYAVKSGSNNSFQPTDLGKALVAAYEEMGYDLFRPQIRSKMEADMSCISSGVCVKDEVVRRWMDTMKRVFLDIRAKASIMEQILGQYFPHSHDIGPNGRSGGGGGGGGGGGSGGGGGGGGGSGSVSGGSGSGGGGGGGGWGCGGGDGRAIASALFAVPAIAGGNSHVHSQINATGSRNSGLAVVSVSGALMVRWCFSCGQRMSVQPQRRDSRGYILVCEVASCASIIRLPLCSSIEVMKSCCHICSESRLSIQLVSIVLAESQVQVQGCLMGCNSIHIRRMLQDANHLMSESELFSRVRPQRVHTIQSPSHHMQQAAGVFFFIFGII
jgi:hypothetical protein